MAQTAQEALAEKNKAVTPNPTGATKETVKEVTNEKDKDKPLEVAFIITEAGKSVPIVLHEIQKGQTAGAKYFGSDYTKIKTLEDLKEIVFQEEDFVSNVIIPALKRFFLALYKEATTEEDGVTQVSDPQIIQENYRKMYIDASARGASMSDLKDQLTEAFKDLRKLQAKFDVKNIMSPDSQAYLTAVQKLTKIEAGIAAKRSDKADKADTAKETKSEPAVAVKA